MSGQRADPASEPVDHGTEHDSDEVGTGEDTGDGPGVADLVLFTSGVVAVVGGTWISNTTVVVIGAVVALVGVVLPLRSLSRRMRA